MKISRVFTLVVISAMIIVLAACGGKSVTYAEGDQKDQAVAAADPIAKDILDGMQQKDYTTFSKDFSDVMLKGITEESFNSMVEKFSAYGTFKSSELVNVEVVDPYFRVNYKLTYDQKVLVMGVVIPQSGDVKVEGLWFK
jgi:hypothetical protein